MIVWQAPGIGDIVACWHVLRVQLCRYIWGLDGPSTQKKTLRALKP